MPYYKILFTRQVSEEVDVEAKDKAEAEIKVRVKHGPIEVLSVEPIKTKYEHPYHGVVCEDCGGVLKKTGQLGTMVFYTCTKCKARKAIKRWYG